MGFTTEEAPMEQLFVWHIEEILEIFNEDALNSELLFQKYKEIYDGTPDSMQVLIAVQFEIERSIPSSVSLITDTLKLCLDDSDKMMSSFGEIYLSHFASESLIVDLLYHWEELSLSVRGKYLRILAHKNLESSELTRHILTLFEKDDLDNQVIALVYLAHLREHQEFHSSKATELYEKADGAKRKNILYSFIFAPSLSAQGLALFARALTDEDEDLQHEAVGFLSYFEASSEEIVKLLLTRAKSANDDLQFSIIVTLQLHKIFNAPVVDYLTRSLSNPTAEVRASAIEALGQIPYYNQQIHETLYNHLSDREETVRLAALSVLGEYPDQAEKLKKSLTSLGQHNNQQVQRFAKKSLVEFFDNQME